MTVLLIEASARPLNSERASHSSLSRSLGRVFTQKLLEYSPEEEIIYRDVGESPPHLSAMNGLARSSHLITKELNNKNSYSASLTRSLMSWYALS